MTADERIEKLLNRFGQTVSDLPKPTSKQYAYKASHNINAAFAARDWENNESFPSVCDLTDYICHLADVIDRMEVALETATNTMDCHYCKEFNEYCRLDCKSHARIADWKLHGLYDPFLSTEGTDDSGRED